jgi:restriction system protein
MKEASMAIKWMVRAGEKGYLMGEFERGGFIAIGWHELGDLSSISSKDELKEHYERTYPNENSNKVGSAVGVIYKFRYELEVGNKVITYNPQTREYMIGTIESDYYYGTDDDEINPEISDYIHFRRVNWEGNVSRDKLSVASRYSLGSGKTLFSVNEEVSTELLSLLDNNGDIDDPRLDDPIIPDEPIIPDTRELIKDKILRLSHDEMEQLAATILRAMGYKTRVTPKGPDRGVDVLASPDGLGLEAPRIKVQVKHRSVTMGSQEIRCFLGGLHEGDSALYISTGGFTKDAKYEADCSNIPMTLLNLDDLATLIVRHYENFDVEGQVLMPLVKVYFPTE